MICITWNCWWYLCRSLNFLNNWNSLNFHGLRLNSVQPWKKDKTLLLWLFLVYFTNTIKRCQITVYLCFTFTRFFKPHLFQVCAPGYKNTFKNNDTSGACVYFKNENPSDISSFLIRIPASDTYSFSWSMFGFSTTAGIVRLCFYLRYKVLFYRKDQQIRNLVLTSTI